ncbi:MAG: cytochrome P450 [Ectothiorhodospiraceae bacterium]|nr:cytochrome P450 [Ectothiorhodospiraceae bacterium]
MELVYDPTRPDIRRDPFPLYQQLQENDPVHWSEPLQSWIVTRYADVRKVAMSKELSPDRLTPFYEASRGERRELLTEIMRYLNRWLVFRDPPEHTRLRRLLNTVFTPSAIASLRPTITGTVEHILADIDDSQPIDFISKFAMLLPGYVIMDMLDIPREDFPKIKVWSDDMRLFIGSARDVPDKYQRAHDGCVNMAEYFRGVIRERRANPGEDFVSRMTKARDEGNMLTEDELIATCMLLLFAGHETTTNLLGNAVKAMIDFPEQRERLRENPDMIETAVEEFLRYDGPSNSIARVVAVDHELGGKQLRKGERVFAMINAANRDPQQFERPQDLDLSRSPNRHLTFGQGPHFCLGAPLARLEGNVALAIIAERFPNLRAADKEPDWVDALIMRGLMRLPVRLT